MGGIIAFNRPIVPALATAIKTKFIDKNVIDPDAATIVGSAITTYSRLTDAAGANIVFPKVDPELVDITELIGAANERLAVAKECKQDAACYTKYLDDKGFNKAEKAVFMLTRMGKSSLPALLKHVGDQNGNGVVRMAVLFGLSRLADKSCADCRKVLDDQITLDSTKPPLRGIVDEMIATRAGIFH